MKDVAVGEIYPISNGGTVRVVRVKSQSEITVEHQDSHKYRKDYKARDIRKGAIKNPYLPSVCGIGFMGVGEFTSSKDGKKTREYKVWHSMIQRCYDAKHKTKQKIHWYDDCTVCNEWHNFQVFAAWLVSNKYFNESFDLDKDIINPNNKIYSPKNCALVPRSINNLTQKTERGSSGLLGAFHFKDNNTYKAVISIDGKSKDLGRYKTPQEAHQAYVVAKEAYVKEVANKWRGRIDERVYNALMNWTVS